MSSEIYCMLPLHFENTVNYTIIMDVKTVD